ncbi:MAG TPA: four helix bundle protein [Candidatus Sulfotelmatobacter sp.]|nr:four helix bundle protein [Candidatus Sulfotelmatobacter sp.]
MATICNSEALKERTKRFALQVIQLCRAMPLRGNFCVRQRLSGQITGLCAGARSTADFVSKLGIVLEEADETLFWRELLVDSGEAKADAAAPLLREANELQLIS